VPGGRNVVINLKRWLLGVPWYADALEDYRHMVVNHEVGHFLGHGTRPMWTGGHCRHR
jgi:hypothetical protein